MTKASLPISNNDEIPSMNEAEFSRARLKAALAAVAAVATRRSLEGGEATLSDIDDIRHLADGALSETHGDLLDRIAQPDGAEIILLRSSLMQIEEAVGDTPAEDEAMSLVVSHAGRIATGVMSGRPVVWEHR
jgi:hypothetical protein